MSTVVPEKTALSRLPGIAWILAAGVAGFLGAFLLGMAERPEGQTQGRLLVAGALLAAGTGIIWLRRPRPSRRLAIWSVLLATGWVIAAVVGMPWYQHGRDALAFVLLPAAPPILAGLASLRDARRGSP
jgi:multisubunit Na+/H+ antiporter MnhB subunit